MFRRILLCYFAAKLHKCFVDFTGLYIGIRVRSL